MAHEYLGIVNGLITDRQLNDLVGITIGTYVNSDEIDLTFHKFKVDNKILLVSNEFIKHSITWNSLNAKGVVAGKDFVDSFKKFSVRLLRGCDTDPGKTVGGEWKSLFIDNSLNIATTYMTTMCKEVYNGSDTLKCVVVGRDNAMDYLWFLEKGTAIDSCGWRPVLEITSTWCDISMFNQDLGEITSWNNISYSVYGDSHTIIEKIDGEIIKNLSNKVGGTSYTLSLSDKWNSLSYGKHTLEIIATDSNGLHDSRTITFNKIKPPIATIPTSSTLTQAVNHMIELNKEIDYQETKLKTNLSDKGVEVLESDKMSNLIDKVGSIPLGKKWASGTVTSNSTTGIIQFLNNTTTRSLYSIEISNIGFKPRYIIATHHYGSTTTYKTMYTIEKDTERMSVMTESLANVSSECHVYKPYGIFLVREGYAILPVLRSSSSYEWIAYE